MSPHANGEPLVNGDSDHPQNGSKFIVDYGPGNPARAFEITDSGDINRQRLADASVDPDLPRPNILYIMADQMAAPALKMHDPNSVIKTPNIDALAESGVVFNSAYCNSPLCAPSRFCMVSGKLPHKIGAYDNASFLASDVPTYAHCLRKHGYETALAGKMHFIGPDQLHGYEHRLTSDIYPGDFGWSVNWDNPKERQEWYHNMSSVWQAGPCARSNQLDFDEEVGYKTRQYLYDYARKDPNSRRPFCLTTSMTHPHDPYTISPKYWNMYEDVDIPLPKTSFSQDQQDPHAKRIMQTVELWDRPLTEDSIKRARRAYFGACSFIDDQLGQTLEVLRDCGLADNTIVIFSGDHGDMLGERSLWYKMNWYENSARVPLIVHYPRLFKPHRVAEHVSTIDMLPTFMDMIRAPIPEFLKAEIDGRSFYSALTGKGKVEDEVFGEYMGEGTISPVVMIRRGCYKYITSLVDPPQLFDLDADPLELKNLAESPEHLKVARAFADQAKEKWSLQKMHDEALSSQRRRRLCWDALKAGDRFESWDYEPPYDAAFKYIRSTIPLDDLERRARYPPVDAYGKVSWLASTHGLAGARGQ